MPWLLTLRRRRVGLHTAAALALVLLVACGDGDANGPSAPDTPHGWIPAPPQPDPQPAPPPADQPPPPDQPVVDDFIGAYTLARVNDGFPGQLSTVANDDGTLVGLYRFGDSSTLTLEADGTWSMSLQYSDDKGDFVLDDEGAFTQAAGQLLFQSAVFGDQFRGEGQPIAVAIAYDLDGNGEADVILGFARVLPPGV